MAIAINQLVLTNGTTSVDLIDNVNYAVEGGGYAPRVSKLKRDVFGGGSRYRDVEDRIMVYCLGSSPANAIGKLNTLATLINQSQRWYNGEPVGVVKLIMRLGGGNLNSAYGSVLVGGEADQDLGLSPTFLERLGAWQVGPISLIFTRRGQWLANTPEVAISTPYNTTSDDIRVMTVAFDNAGEGAIDVELLGLQWLDDGSPLVKSLMEEGYLLIGEVGKVGVKEAEDCDPVGSTFESGLNVTTVTGRASGGGVMMVNSSNPVPFPSAVGFTYTQSGGGQVLGGSENVGVFVMVGTANPTHEYRVRAIGISNDRRIATPWTLFDFSDTTDELGATERTRSRPLFLGTVASLGGFQRIDIEFELATEIEGGVAIPVNNRLLIDYIGAIDMVSPYSKVLYLDRYGATYSTEIEAGTETKLVFNTGAYTLVEPRCYMEAITSESVIEQGQGFSSEPTGQVPRIAESRTLFYKHPLGDTYLEATQRMGVVWFGRGQQSTSATGFGASVPIGGNWGTPSGLDLSVRLTRRRAFLVPQAGGAGIA
jgi:hypothetical protein